MKINTHTHLDTITQVVEWAQETYYTCAHTYTPTGHTHPHIYAHTHHNA